MSKPFKTAELSRVINLALEATQDGAKAMEPKRSYWADYRQIRMLVTREPESWEAHIYDKQSSKYLHRDKVNDPEAGKELLWGWVKANFKLDPNAPQPEWQDE